MKKVLIGLLVVILVLGLVGLVLPKDYNFSRSVTINATPAQVHTLVGDLAKWPDWAPWYDEDPTIKTTLGARTTGVGASQSWTADSGGGRLTLTRCDAEQGIAYDMAFVEDDHEMPAKSWMSYKPVAGGTEVTWGLEGTMRMPVIGGYFTLLMPMMAGGMFDKGLNKLKTKVETK